MFKCTDPEKVRLQQEERAVSKKNIIRKGGSDNQAPKKGPSVMGSKAPETSPEATETVPEVVSEPEAKPVKPVKPAKPKAKKKTKKSKKK